MKLNTISGWGKSKYDTGKRCTIKGAQPGTKNTYCSIFWYTIYTLAFQVKLLKSCNSHYEFLYFLYTMQAWNLTHSYFLLKEIWNGILKVIWFFVKIAYTNLTCLQWRLFTGWIQRGKTMWYESPCSQPHSSHTRQVHKLKKICCRKYNNWF